MSKTNDNDRGRASQAGFSERLSGGSRLGDGAVSDVLGQAEGAMQHHEAVRARRQPADRRRAKYLRCFDYCPKLTWRDRLGLSVIYATDYKGDSPGLAGGAAALARLLGGSEHHWRTLSRKWADLAIVTVQKVKGERAARIFPVVKTPPALWELCRAGYSSRNGNGWGPGGQAVPPTLASVGFWVVWLPFGSDGEAETPPESTTESPPSVPPTAASVPPNGRQRTISNSKQRSPTETTTTGAGFASRHDQKDSSEHLACSNGEVVNSSDSKADISPADAEAGKLSMAALAVLSVTADYADRNGGGAFRVSRRVLCNRLGMWPNSLQAALAELAEVGELVLVHDGGRHGRWWLVPYACPKATASASSPAAGDGRTAGTGPDAKGLQDRTPDGPAEKPAAKPARRPLCGGHSSFETKRVRFLQQFESAGKLTAAGQAAGCNGDDQQKQAAAIRGTFEQATTPNRAAAALAIAGVKPMEKAQAVVKTYGVERVQANGLLVADRLDGSKAIHNIAALVLTAIENNYAADPPRTGAADQPAGAGDAEPLKRADMIAMAIAHTWAVLSVPDLAEAAAKLDERIGWTMDHLARLYNPDVVVVATAAPNVPGRLATAVLAATDVGLIDQGTG